MESSKSLDGNVRLNKTPSFGEIQRQFECKMVQNVSEILIDIHSDKLRMVLFSLVTQMDKRLVFECVYEIF